MMGVLGQHKNKIIVRKRDLGKMEVNDGRMVGFDAA